MEKKKLYKILLISALSLCAFSFLWAWWVTRGVRGNSAESLATQKISVNNLVLTETKNKKKYWELYSKRAEYDSSSTEVILYNIIGNFYNEEGEVVLSFSSPKGIYVQETEKVTLIGETRIATKDNSFARADRFEWEGKNSNIRAIGNVYLNRNNDIIAKANEAVFKPDLTWFKILGKSETKVYSKDKKNSKDSKVGFFKWEKY